MNDRDFTRLLEELRDQTADGDRRWEETPGEREAFFTPLDAGTVAISRRPARFPDESGEFVRVDQFLVRVLTAGGEAVSERSFVGPAAFGIGDGETADFVQVRDLWNAARETARGADELIRALLREVRSESVGATPARTAA